MSRMYQKLALILLSALLLGLLSACGSTALMGSEPDPSAVPELLPTAAQTRQYCVVIDPGHQRIGNAERELIGPDAAETKAKVTGGTTGRFTGVPEYVLNLTLSLQLRDELRSRGYRVVMTRDDHDVDLSNRERAAIATSAGGDIFVRMHANGDEDPGRSGAMTICMTADSPYHSDLYETSYALSEQILTHLSERTGCRSEGVMETDTMTGINWATIPVTIVEVGYMTNEAEDRSLQTDAYQKLVVQGIADGIDAYFAQHGAEDAATDSELQAIMEDCLKDETAVWDVYAERLDDNCIAKVQTFPPEDGKMVSASLIKLFVMGAVYTEIEKGALSHDAVYADLRSMITVSDNDATNRLIELLGGMEKVNAFADRLGCEHTQLNRLMLEDNGLQNYTSASDCAQILRMIAAGTCVNARWSEEMMSLLKDQTVNDRLPARLPADTIVAHKTGNLPGLSCGDVGIIFADQHCYLLCAICNDPSDDLRAATEIAELSKIVYDYFQ